MALFRSIHAAAREGNLDRVRQYLERGGDPNVCDEGRGTPLYYAAAAGRCDVMEVLLDHSADVDAMTLRGDGPLLQTVQQGYPNAVELLLRNGANVNARTESGVTPFMTAALLEHAGIAHLLAQSGANVDEQNNQGKSSFFLAIEKDMGKVVDLLLDVGVDINGLSIEGHTPLMVATQNNAPEIARILIARGAIVNAVSAEGVSALLVAALHGLLDMAKLLLEAGAEVNPKAEGPITPFMLASSKGHKEVAALLKEHGATGSSDLDIFEAVASGHTGKVEEILHVKPHYANRKTTHSGWTPLHIAGICGNAEMAALLLDKGADVDGTNDHGKATIHYAAMQGDMDMLEVLLANGVGVDLPYKGRTVLQWVRRGKHKKEIIDLLRKHGAKGEASFSIFDEVQAGSLGEVEKILHASPDAVGARTSSHDWTPLHVAASKGNEAMVELLLAHEADVNAVNKKGKNIVHVAAERGYARIVELLLANGAQASYAYQERTPTEAAVLGGHEAVIKVLENKDLEDGVEPDLVSAIMAGNAGEVAKILFAHPRIANRRFALNRWTPLQIAAKAGNGEIVELLLDFGAGVNAKSKNGNTAIHLAAAEGHAAVTQVLLAKGADPSITCEGKTPLDVALHEKQQAVAQLLQNHRQTPDENPK